MQVEIVDRFGFIPDEGKNLLRLTRMRLKAEVIGIVNIDIGNKGGKFVFHEKPNIDPMALIQLIHQAPTRYTMAGSTTLRIKEDFADSDQRMETVEALLSDLASQALPDESAADVIASG